MSFDRDTRNKLARMVADARRRLVTDATDSLRRLGLQDDGTLVPFSALGGLSDTERGASEALRELLGHFAAQEPDGSDAIRARNAHGRLVREIGFTTLNRLVALRMAEERGLIIESVRNGFAATGFQLFERIANGGLGSRAQTYRAYLESLYDELAVDLPSLFSRTGPESQVFPDEATLEAVLGLLNDPALADLWKEDETIGWVYQYYNDPDERKKMREASQAPRNSRELAVRNQFFTPRYVVEFLTDNTLGRTWYEMRQGDTRLRDDCRYLVRRPTEIFLQSGESAPATSDETADLSQEDLLKQPVYVPFRPKKDPRDLKILDPACGSGHFLLYSFDLLETMYEEAWSDDSSPRSEVSKHRLCDDYGTLAELRAAIPGLILRHNLHGLDIDPRAVQIAGLALWLRAQASYQALGLRPVERPRLTKGNLVVAEPMPGERDLVDQFVSRLDPPLIGGLVKLVFTKMQLVGEAGTLLKIEEELRDAISSAKVVWQRGPKLQQLALLPEEVRSKSEQMALELDTSGISDETFWERVEERVFAELRNFAAEASDRDATRRRLFADDAARGFAFVDLCSKRYDVVLMNPPFGDGSPTIRPYVEEQYADSRQDLFACFVERAVSGLALDGLVGLISAEAGFFRRTLEPWRRNVVLERCTLNAMAHLGGHVLDGATVRTAAYTLRPSRERTRSLFIRVVGREDRAGLLEQATRQIHSGERSQLVFEAFQAEFEPLPYAVFGYWCSPQLRSMFKESPTLEGRFAQVRVGLQTSDDFRFLRLRWEVPPEHVGIQKGWTPLAKGGEYSPFHDDVHLTVRWGADGRELEAFEGSVIRNPDSYGRPGLTYPRRTNKRFAPRLLPAGCAFADKGPAILTNTSDPLALAALLNSRTLSYLLGLGVGASESEGGAGANSYEVGLVQHLPIPPQAATDADLAALGRAAWEARAEPDLRDETTIRFVSPMHPVAPLASLHEVSSQLSERRHNCEMRYSDAQDQIDQHVRILYGLTQDDWVDVEEHVGPAHRVSAPTAPEILQELAPTVVQYALGCAYGRWISPLDLRLTEAPVMRGPLERISARPPAQRDCRETEAPPLLVDDPSSSADVLIHMQRKLEEIWGDGSALVEHEIIQTFGLRGLREYLQRPSGFFADHLKRYSKSRRQAPIYWPISTVSGSYTVWVYYDRLNSDTLFTAMNRYVEPKRADVQRQLREARDEHSAASGREGSSLLARIEELTAFLDELNDLRDELLRITQLPYQPNLDDGVIINAAPLHKLFRLPKWAKDTRQVWQKLERGDYDWAHMAYTIWPDRVREKCRSDRSLAIAHHLEPLYSGPPPSAGKRRARAATLAIDEDNE